MKKSVIVGIVAALVLTSAAFAQNPAPTPAPAPAVATQAVTSFTGLQSGQLIILMGQPSVVQTNEFGQWAIFPVEPAKTESVADATPAAAASTVVTKPTVVRQSGSRRTGGGQVVYGTVPSGNVVATAQPEKKPFISGDDVQKFAGTTVGNTVMLRTSGAVKNTGKAVKGSAAGAGTEFAVDKVGNFLRGK